MKNKLSKSLKVINLQKLSTGFTLIELLIAAAITGIAISAAGFGLATIMGADRKAEGQTERRVALNRTLDYIANEIRTARRVNTTTNTTVSADTARTTAATTYGAFNPSLGSIGNIVLYLEIPVTGNIPTTCPSGGPNPGSPPPLPSTFDRVVYDIRPNTITWLEPRVINRYGRIPRNDGTINPCSNPVASEALVDSISDSNISPTPTCNSPGVLSGIEGFYACANGRQVELYLSGKLTDAYGNSTGPLNVKTRVFVRSAP